MVPPPLWVAPLGLLHLIMPYWRAFQCTISVDVSGLGVQGANHLDCVSTPNDAIQFIGTDAEVTFEREVH